MVDNQETTGGRNWRRTLRITSIILAILLIALGIFNFGTIDLGDPINVILPVYYVFFGLMMIGAEVPCNFLLQKFLFISGYFGRGIFYIFVGTLCIRYHTVFQFIVAAFLMGVGIIYIFSSCSSCYKNFAAQNDQMKQEEEAKQNSQTELKQSI
ncbi:unnamed protein product [Blepharisma stoltei]|uniref:COPI associated protein n=1 Tax=Blepharisma stoltei TaxID=1481888 RepID=A0AAU9JT71_9CILI|nr:unnamed protein product [Blepharisma stoltei]